MAPSCDLATITGAASLQALLALAGVGMSGCPLVPIAQAELSSPGQQCQGSCHPSSSEPQHVAQDIRVAPGCPHSPMNHPVSMSLVGQCCPVWLLQTLSLSPSLSLQLLSFPWGCSAWGGCVGTACAAQCLVLPLAAMCPLLRLGDALTTTPVWVNCLNLSVRVGSKGWSCSATHGAGIWCPTLHHHHQAPCRQSPRGRRHRRVNDGDRGARGRTLEKTEIAPH